MKNNLLITLILIISASCSGLSSQKVYDPKSFTDRSHSMHGIFGVAGLSRGSEMGHENYRPELAGEPMAEKAKLWIKLVKKLDRDFNHQGKLKSAKNSDQTSLALYPHGVYAYHMHHRAGRWSAHGLENEILYTSLNYLVEPGIYLMKNHYHQGRFYHDLKNEKIDKNSISHGMAGMHGHVYAWVRWAKPSGAEDMGKVSKERLVAHLKYSPEQLLEVFARPVAEFLYASWHPEVGMYRFDDNDIWELETIGSLLRGLKSVYETLYMFGDLRDRKRATKLATHAAIILERTLSLAKPWGLPSHIEFIPDEVHAKSNLVDTQALWSFVNHLGSGFALLSEDEGMSQYISDGPLVYAPEQIGQAIDSWLEYTLEKNNELGLLPASYYFADGSIADATAHTANIGIFSVAAANNYRRGEAFERARDWNDINTNIRLRSRDLYDLLLEHYDFLEESIRAK